MAHRTRAIGRGRDRSHAAWRVALAGLAAGLLTLPGTGVDAQLASASPAALGMADNYTAVARGFDAVAWNPAVLGLRGSRGRSFTLLPARGSTGLGPVPLSDIADYADVLVPAGVKQDWLARITADGGQTGTAGADLTWVALHLGNVALQASSSARATADIAPGIAELVLFGNVGADGQARALDLSGSQMFAHAFSTFAASVGVPVPLATARLAVGVTATYTIGHALAFGEQSTGFTSSNPLAVQLGFPLVHTAVDAGSPAGRAGSGFGLDAGLALEGARVTVAATVRNVLSSFAWDPAYLRYRPLTIVLDADTSASTTEDAPLSAAPAALRARVGTLGFDPVVSAGIAYRVSPRLLLAADVRAASTESPGTVSTRHAGAGLEFRPLPWLPLRAGAAAISLGDEASGTQIAGGLGIDLGRLNVAVSALRRSAGRLGDATTLMFSVISIGR